MEKLSTLTLTTDASPTSPTSLPSSSLTMAKSNFKKVQEFNRAFDMAPKEPANYVDGEIDFYGRPQPDAFIHIRPKLFTTSPKLIKLRLDLIDEEIEELTHSIETNDFVETRDALADILYVAYGMADVLGINIDCYFKNIIDNNDMSRYGNKIRTQIFQYWFKNAEQYSNQDETNGIPIGHSNFDLVRLLIDTIPDKFTQISAYNTNSKTENLKVIHSYIVGNYNALEAYCLNDEELQEDLRVDLNADSKITFSSIANYIFQILKWVYTYAHIAGVHADADFAIVHRSNMSKLCDTEMDAKLTVADYIEKYVSGTSPYDTPYYYELPELGKWIVKNKSTGKALKNIKYQKVNFSS